MNAEDIRTYCLNKPGAVVNYPFGAEPACFRVCNKIFAELYLSPDRHWVTLKCEPMRADFYRQQYPGIVVRGYHCPSTQQPYHNTISFDRMETATLVEMIDHAYDRVVQGLTRRARAELEASLCP